MLDFRRSHQLLASSHVGERDKALLCGVMVGGVWNGFLLGKMRGEAVPCRFCGGADGDGHLFWDCPYPLLNEIRENMRMDKSQSPGCLLWHGWLLLLSGVNGESPWAVTADDAAVKMLESALGVYSSDIFQGWDVPQSVDWDSAADRPPHPDVWIDGSLVRDDISGAASAGSGVYARLHADTWTNRRWGHFDDLGLTPDGLAASCRGFCSLPGLLQTVQRAEFFGCDFCFTGI